MKKINERIADVLSGRVDFEDECNAIQMSCCLHFYRGACEILEAESKAQRRRMLAKLPKKIRPYIETEMLRLWRLKKARAE